MNPAATQSTSLTDGPILGALLRLATPMLAGAVLQNIHSLIDMFWVGRLGPDAVASVAMGATVLMLLFPMLMGLSTGTVAVVARAMGAGLPQEASRAAAQSLVMGLVIGILSGWLGWHFTDDILWLLGADDLVTTGGTAYLRISLLGSFTVFLLFIATAALQGAGDAISPMWIMGLSNVLNIALDPLFIFGWGPVPAMGVQGAAFATLLSQAAAAVLVIHLLFRGKSPIRVRMPQLKPDLPLCWRLLRIGIPGSGQMLSRSLMSAIMMRIVAGCGTAAVAAYGTGLRFHMILLMPAFALGGAAATMVGQNLGAGKPERARRAAWLATWIDIALMAACCLAIMAFARPLMAVFNRDPDVIAIGTRYLQIVSPAYVLAAVGIVLGRALNGAGDTMSPMIATVVSLWVLQVPLGILFARIWQPATHGIWWAIVIGAAAHSLMILAWFETNRWMKGKV